MSMPYRLHYAPDNASLVIRLALDLLEQPFDTVLVDRKARAQKSAPYLALNPQGLIPTLETPDGPLFETGAILLWLADRHGALAPAPRSAERATFLKWVFFTSNTLHPVLRSTFYPDQYVGTDAGAQAALRSTAHIRLHDHLTTLSDAIERGEISTYGPTPSVLALYLACLLRWCALYPQGHTQWFTLARYPGLEALARQVERCAATPKAIDAEGLGPRPFTAPVFATPKEGSAT